MAILDPVSSRNLLEVIQDRFRAKGTIIATQLPFARWHDLFEDSTIADTILDRVIHTHIDFNRVVILNARIISRKKLVT